MNSLLICSMILDEIHRPRQVICFKPFAFQTALEGSVYVFFAIDIFSHYAFSTPPSKDIGDASIMNQVNLLMNEKDFRTEDNLPFTLVIDIAEELLEELNIIVEPYGGQVIYDPDFVQEHMMPDMNTLLEMMLRGGADDGR